MDELASKHQSEIAELSFIPSSGGVFEVTVNGNLVFSKKEIGRFPNEGEITDRIAAKQGWAH